MAIEAPYTKVSVNTSGTVAVYTAPAGYTRDLILTNGGTAAVYVTSGATANTSNSLQIPVGQTVVLMGPVESVVGVTAAGTATMYVGLGSVVSVI